MAGRKGTICIMDNPLVKKPMSIDSALQRFQWKIEEKYKKKFEDYWEFHEWSVENYASFWKEVWSFLKIVHSEPYTEVIEPDKKFEEIPKWFLGARLNYAENMLKHPNENVALIVTGEEKPIPKFLTFGELREEVALLSSALKNAGVKQGDVVACFISNRKEAIVAMLAAACIGALFTSTNPLMGVQAVVMRFRQVTPKILFTVDRYVYDRKEKDVLSLLPDLVKSLKSLEYVVIAPSTEESLNKDIQFVPKSIFYPNFLKMGLTQKGDTPPLKYEQLPFNHPFYITYTSGTTGIPKGIVHSAGAALLSPLKELALQMNVKSSDILFCIFATGWVTWNFFVAALSLGASLVIYEGVPFYHYPNAFWDLIDKYGVTIAFLSPIVIEDMEKKSLLPASHNHLSSLHTLGSGSCHVKAHSFDFVYEKIKSDVFFATNYGSTEFLAMFAGLNYTLPVYKEELQSVFLGIDMCCYNEDGERIFDRIGELIIRKPFPSMPLYLWNDNDRKRYRESFFEKFPGVWCHGDRCVFNSKTRGLVVKGRSDETIKQRGTRFGCIEIYGIVNKLKDVADSLCVSRHLKDGTEVAVLFIKMKPGLFYTLDTMCHIQNEIAAELSKRHVPEFIFPVKDIPYNLSGKRMEVLIKKILSGFKNFSKDILLNPDSLSEYVNYADNLEHLSF